MGVVPEISQRHPSEFMGLVADQVFLAMRRAKQESGVVVEVGGFVTERGDRVDVEVEYLGRDCLQGVDAALLVCFAGGTCKDVGVTVDVAAEL